MGFRGQVSGVGFYACYATSLRFSTQRRRDAEIFRREKKMPIRTGVLSVCGIYSSAFFSASQRLCVEKRNDIGLQA